MKGFFFVFTLFVIAASANANDLEEIDDMAKECMTEAGITDERPPELGVDEANSKCFYACLLTKMGNMANGKVVLQKELEDAAKVWKDEMDDKVKSRITECVNTANMENDKCEVMFAMYKCVKENKITPDFKSVN